MMPTRLRLPRFRGTLFQPEKETEMPNPEAAVSDDIPLLSLPAVWASSVARRQPATLVGPIVGIGAKLKLK